MRWVILFGFALLLSGCLGELNPAFFPNRQKDTTVECGKNFDLCLEKAEYYCGPRGYTILKKTKTKKGYSLDIQCNR